MNMMNSLFSIFDPTSSLPIMKNWISISLFIFILSSSFWLTPNLFLSFLLKIMNSIFLEFKMLLSKFNYSSLILFITLFMLIATNNFLGLFPYIFTSTSHLVTNLTLALPLWISFMLYGWINNMNHMFIHLVPQNTPPMLMSFMVLIESVSNIIRPITLSVRLSANMIAGHLLMTLLGNQTASVSEGMIILVLNVQILLSILEMAVSIIQAYVFSVLASLYSNEIV